MRKAGYCKKEIGNKSLGIYNAHQCLYKAVKDGYCTIHHPNYIRLKAEERRKKRDAEHERRELQAKIRQYEIAANICQSEGYIGAHTHFLRIVKMLKESMVENG